MAWSRYSICSEKAITVAPSSRKQGLARILMNYLEDISNYYKGYFIDLFVRPSNLAAVSMYEHMGYRTYRVVNKYYSSSHKKAEDAFDMRKSLKQDPNNETSEPTNEKIEPSDLEFH